MRTTLLKQIDRMEKASRLCSAFTSDPDFKYIQAKNLYTCQVKIPSHGFVRIESQSAEEAMTKLFLSVQSLILKKPSVETWPEEWQSLALSTKHKIGARKTASTVVPSNVVKFQAKDTLQTIGVTIKSDLINTLEELANQQNRTFSSTARDIFRDGFEKIDSRLEEESSEKVFVECEKLLFALNLGKPSEFMLRIDRKSYIRAKLLAKEVGKSLSQIALISLTYGLKHID